MVRRDRPHIGRHQVRRTLAACYATGLRCPRPATLVRGSSATNSDRVGEHASCVLVTLEYQTDQPSVMLASVSWPVLPHRKRTEDQSQVLSAKIDWSFHISSPLKKTSHDAESPSVL